MLFERLNLGKENTLGVEKKSERKSDQRLAAIVYCKHTCNAQTDTSETK